MSDHFSYSCVGKEGQQNLWMSVCRQCAITPNVGHALSIALLHQKLCFGGEAQIFSEGDGGNEEWESVTAERGHWATLHSNLEVLVHLCNVVGPDALRRLPSLPFDEVPEDEDDDNVVDPSKLKFYNKGV